LSDHSRSSRLEVLDRVPGDASSPTGTRRWLLERAAVGAAGVAAASVIPASALAGKRRDSTRDVGVFTFSDDEVLVEALAWEPVRADYRLRPQPLADTFALMWHLGGSAHTSNRRGKPCRLLPRHSNPVFR
jgi:hypothetical protein